MGLNDHIDDGKGPSPPVYIDGIIAMLKKEGWIEDKTLFLGPARAGHKMPYAASQKPVKGMT